MTPLQSPDASVLIIYTGGTIGSAQDPVTGGLVPIDFSEIHRHVPELDQPGRVIDAHSFDPLIDSSNMGPAHGGGWFPSFPRGTTSSTGSSSCTAQTRWRTRRAH